MRAEPREEDVTRSTARSGDGVRGAIPGKAKEGVERFARQGKKRRKATEDL